MQKSYWNVLKKVKFGEKYQENFCSTNDFYNKEKDWTKNRERERGTTFSERVKACTMIRFVSEKTRASVSGWEKERGRHVER